MSTLLSTALSLAAVYVAFSLLVSWVNEQIATLLQKRGTTLIHGIAQMVGTDVQSQLYGHPIITATVPTSGKLPQYISSRQFSSALIGYLGTIRSFQHSQETLGTDLQAAIDGLGNTPLQHSLQAIYDRCGYDYNAFVTGVERWYDDQMNRVSGWYHQWATLAMMLISLAVVSLFNVDTLHVIKQVSCDASLRARLASQISSTATLTAENAANSIFTNVRFGWSPRVGEAVPCGTEQHEGPRLFWFLKVIGLVLSAIALSLGAPFWFDALKLLVNVRNAGQAPAPAQGGQAGPS
ncbi:MAG: hypothetical protein ACXWNK_11000 [Vulcanimicrobiaceae bacterium]